MLQPEREDIHVTGRLTQWPREAVQQALEDHVYRDKAAWRRFLPLLCLTLGVGLTAAGIVFFFAYNWAVLHKYVKFGVIEGLLVLVTLAAVLTKLPLVAKKALLTGAAVLVGVLLAVFGQVYQTGADAYDLFLSWTLAIVVWVVVAHFAPLWLLFIILCNMTLHLYAEQVANNWSNLFRLTMLFLLTTAFALAGLLLNKWKPAARVPGWSILVVMTGAVVIATLAGVIAPFGRRSALDDLLFNGTMLPLYAVGIWYGYRVRNLFFLSILPFSLIIMATAWLAHFSTDEGMIFFICFFVLICVTLLTWWLVRFQKNTAYEKTI